MGPKVFERFSRQNCSLFSFSLAAMLCLPWLGCSQPEGSAARETTSLVTAAPTPAVAPQKTPPVAPTWPNLFGPGHDSICQETGLNFTWPNTGPPELWRHEIGEGYTAPVAIDGRLIVFHRQGDQEIVETLDAESGESLWRYGYPTAYKCKYEYSDGPASTPIVEHDRVYTLGAEGELVCLDAQGKLVWQRSLAKEYTVPESLFGVGCSPLLEDDRLIINLGGTDPKAGIIAVDKYTGSTLWTASDHPASYSTPVAATIHGQRIVFVLTDEALVALDPADGHMWWSIPFRARTPDSPNATSPAVSGDVVLVSMGNGLGSLAVQVLPYGGYKELWRDRRVLDSQWNNLIILDGFVYGYASSRAAGENFRCVELATGRLCWKWRSDLRRGASLAVDGHFILFGEYGHLGSMKIDSTTPQLVSMTTEPVLDKPCYTVPILYRGRLYLRNVTTLLCLDLRLSSPRP